MVNRKAFMRLWRFLWIGLAAPGLFAADQDWPTVGGDSGCSRYSNLKQIDRANVTQLPLPWTFHCGDQGPAGTIECTPLVIGGVMYLTTAGCKVVALDADTGRPRWK